GTLDLTHDGSSSVTVDQSLTVNGAILLGAPDGSTSGSLYGNPDGPCTVQLGGSKDNLFDNPGGDVTIQAGVTVRGQNGTLGHSGSTVHNNGAIFADAPGGTISVAGNYAQGPSAVLGVAIASSPTPGAFGHFDCTGTASLDGALDVSLANGFRPADDDQF